MSIGHYTMFTVTVTKKDRKTVEMITNYQAVYIQLIFRSTLSTVSEVESEV